LPQGEQIVTFHVEKGDHVKPNQLIVTLDDSKYLAALEVIEKKIDLCKQKEKWHQLIVDEKTMAYIQLKQDWMIGKKEKEQVDAAIKKTEMAQTELNIQKREIDLLQAQKDSCNKK
jgi:multidrug efflux pump subunit AcrA (membrane-fusion protein)